MIETSVSQGFPMGTYDVLVSNPDGQAAVLHDAVEVLGAPRGDDAGDVAVSADAGSDAAAHGKLDSNAAADGCGCQSVSTGARLPGLWLGLFGLMAGLLAVGRRRLSRH